MTTPEVRHHHANLRRLATLGLPGPFVTLSVPPLRGTAGHQTIDEIGDRLLRETRRALTDDPWHLSAQRADRIVRQASEQLLDAPRSEAEGLMIVVADDYVEAIPVAQPIPPDHVVAERPDLTMLAEAAAAAQEFHLLVLSQHRVELYRCGDGVAVPVAADLPSGLDDVVWLDRQVPESSAHRDVTLFIAAVDRALPPAVHDGPLPLVVAAVAFEAAMLRDARPHRDLVLLTELGSPERLSVEVVQTAAARRLAPRVATDLAALVDRYRSRAGTGRTATGLELVTTDASEGRVDVLLVDAERRGNALPDARARLAVAVAEVIGHGGTVRLVPGQEPSVAIDDLAVALLRY